MWRQNLYIHLKKLLTSTNTHVQNKFCNTFSPYNTLLFRLKKTLIIKKRFYDTLINLFQKIRKTKSQSLYRGYLSIK